MSRNAKAAGILATTLVGPVLISVGIIQINNAQLTSYATGNEGALPLIAGIITMVIGITLWVVNRKA
jgi:hypothetical protein